MNAPVLTPPGSLLFQWEAPRRRRYVILWFVGFSALAHAFCFYLFQIAYPPTVALLPPPGRVNLISPDTEEGRNLLRWIESEDPALATTTQRPADGKFPTLPELHHVPSYLTIQPALRTLPPLQPDRPALSSQPPGPVRLPRPSAPSTPNVVSTSVVFSPELNPLGQIDKPQMKFTASNREAPANARFRIAVSPSGVMRYCFLEDSSGDPQLDEQARRYLILCRFGAKTRTTRSDPGQLTWAIATIEWGNDVGVPVNARNAAP